MGDISNIEDAVFTFDKIVTYKTAGAILGTKVEKTKEILEKYVKDCKKETDKNVHLTYLIGGVTSLGIKRITVVTEKEYEKTKSNFSSIFIDQIYSINKSAAASWDSIFNIDDFLYDDKNLEKCEDQNINNVDEQELESKVLNGFESNTVKITTKKGSISNLFSQLSAKGSEKTVANGKEQNKKTSNKTEPKKKNDIKDMFSRAPPKADTSKIKKDISKSNCDVKIEEFEEEEEEEIVRKSGIKKRCRVLDDEEEESTSKQIKVDILDENSESEIDIKEEDVSDDETIDESSDVETPECDTVKVVEVENQVPDSSTKVDATEKMYEDSDGYFVTEKPAGKKKNNNPVAVLEDTKETQKNTKVEKQQKKEMSEKLKKSTNQKTLFNFFKKN